MVASCTEEDLPNTQEPGLCDTFDYTYADVKTVIDANCIGCHAEGEQAESKGVFTSYEGLQASLAVSSESFINVINSTDEEVRMPPVANLPEADIQKLECWIAAGFPE